MKKEIEAKAIRDKALLHWDVNKTAQNLFGKSHTCARRKTAQVSTAAVVSCPAMSIVIKSSLSCKKEKEPKLVNHG